MQTRSLSAIQGSLERSDSKFDVGPFRVGAFEFIANYQHPPIDRRTRMITVVVVIVSILVAVGATVALRMWLLQFHPILGPVASGLTHVAILGATMCALFIWGSLGFRPREKRLAQELAELSTQETRPPRFTVRGRPSELLEFAAIRDDLFEPQTFSSSHRTIGMQLEWRVFFALLFALMAVLAIVSGIAGHMIWLAYLILPTLTYLLIRGLPVRPTYYRFLPGRLDCLRYRWLLPGKPRVTSLNLRNARLQIDLTTRRDMIVIDIPPRLIPLHRDTLPDPLAFTLALARAALSTATPPPLPMDALTG